MGARVVSSLTAPANTSDRRTKPAPSSTSPRVSSGQSLRFLLGVAAFGLGLGRRLTLEEGVGQVVQRDRLGQGEQVRHLLEQVGLDRRALRQQGIGGPVEAHHAHPLEVHAQQLAEGRTLAQPAPAGALRARCCHARDDGGHGQRALRAVEAEPLQQSLQAELLHGPQPDILDADRARADQLQGTHIHRLQVGALDCGGRCAIEELRGDALGIPAPPLADRTAAPVRPGARAAAGFRAHSTGQCRRSSGKSLPRLSRVCWRTLSPLRSLRTRRYE